MNGKKVSGKLVTGILVTCSLAAFVLVAAGCATTGSSRSASSENSTFMDEARNSESTDDYVFALVSYSCAQATSEITSDQLTAEFTRIKEKIGKEAFANYAQQASAICQTQAETSQKAAEKTGDSQQATLSLLWSLSALNLVMAAY